MKKPIAPIVSGLLMLVTTIAGAQQVGYPPTSSPYKDLEHAQELTLLVGQYHAHRDPADVGPQSGPLFGVHYEWRAGGPAHLIAELARVTSDRRLINPFNSGEAREMGTVSRPLYAGNVGLGLGLTGAKSWHDLVPEISGGMGFVTDLRSVADTGGFKFGTRFAINMGAGIRWIPGGHWQLRGDITNRLYTISYPQAFYDPPTSGGGTPVIPQTQSKSFWNNNPAFTLGISRFF